MIRPFRPVVLLASITFALAPALPANPTEDRAARIQMQINRPNDLESSDRAFFSVSELFYSGPQWFLNALSNPGGTRTTSARLADMTYDRAGDRIVNEGYYVGTLANAYSLSGMDTTSAPFYGSRLEMLASPLVPDAATSIDLYWDANGGLPLTGGSGLWSGSTTNNWRDGSPTGTLRNWSDGHFAHFEGVAATVFVSGGVFPLLAIFEVTGYTLDPVGGTDLTTLGGGIVLSANVNLNLFSFGTTTDRQLAIGSVSGDAGSGLTLQGAQTASGSNARILLWENDASIDVPVTISGTGTTFAGFVATATGTGITGNVTNSSGFTTLLGATAGSDLTVSGIISGTSGVRIGVTDTTPNSGTVTLTNANTYTGLTTVSGGTLNAGATNSLGSTSGITVNSGATLLLSNSATTDRINNSSSAAVKLNGGGTISTGGLTEGTAPSSPSGSDGVAGMGALTLQSTTAGSHATIDFLTGANGSSLVFDSLSGGANAFVDIKNWTGAAGTDTGAIGNDRLLFATNPNLSNAQLANFAFFNDSDAAFAIGGTIIPYGNEFELVAVPEPSTWIGAALGLAAIGLMARRRARKTEILKR